MKPVPHKQKDDEDSITEMKKQNENPIIKNGASLSTDMELKEASKAEESLENDNSKLVKAEEEPSTEVKAENGYLTVLKNVPFLMVMLGNLPAVMGLYIPYMFIPKVEHIHIIDLNCYIFTFFTDHSAEGNVQSRFCSFDFFDWFL